MRRLNAFEVERAKRREVRVPSTSQLNWPKVGYSPTDSHSLSPWDHFLAPGGSSSLISTLTTSRLNNHVAYQLM
jgi:hypothetical protein